MGPGFTECLLLMTLGAILLLLCAVLNTGIIVNGVRIARAPRPFQIAFFVMAFSVVILGFYEKYVELLAASAPSYQMGRIEFGTAPASNFYSSTQVRYDPTSSAYSITRIVHFDHPFKTIPSIYLSLVESVPQDERIRWEITYHSATETDFEIEMVLWPTTGGDKPSSPPMSQFAVQWMAIGQADTSEPPAKSDE